MFNKLLTQRDGKYFYADREINRKTFQKIKYGNWRDFSEEVIQKKLDKRLKAKDRQKTFQIIYEDVMSTPDGQYMFGIAMEKACNNMIRYLKSEIANARKVVRFNRQKFKHPENEDTKKTLNFQSKQNNTFPA